MCDQSCNGHRQKFRLCNTPECGGAECEREIGELSIVKIDNRETFKEVLTESCNDYCK